MASCCLRLKAEGCRPDFFRQVEGIQIEQSLLSLRLLLEALTVFKGQVHQGQ